MSEPADGTVEPDFSHESGPSASAAVPAGAAVGGELRVGQRWRDLIVQSTVTGPVPRTYIAEHLGLMEKVVLRVFPLDDKVEWRRGAWERMVALPEGRIVACLEAHEESGWRYEISALPPAMNMREWMAVHRPDLAGIESFVRQLAATLAAMHAQGVVHLNLRPEAIYVDETKGEPVYLIGGLHEATLYTQPELMPADVDPFYAPPETAGLTRHAPGTRLCAWDWWTVGRVVQEFLLGHHVFALVFDRDVSRPTPDLRTRAENLLLEREPPGVRPGALDYTLVDAVYMPLLRGLLTTACEARWGLDSVQRWLRREPVRDYYDLPRTTRMWNWRGRLFTLAEAAEYFTDAENWDVGEDMLFHPHEPETLAAFLQDVPAHRDDWNRLQAVCDVAESSGWEQLPVVARRTVTAAVAWLALAAGAGARPSFRVRGQPIDTTGLTELLHSGGPEMGVALLSALLLPAVIDYVDPLDASSARMLRTIAAKGGTAVRVAVEHGWLDLNDAAGHARILELALLSGATLRERVDLLRAGYATNSQPELAAVLANREPEPSDLVILAFTGEAPERHGYISHENWRRQQCAKLAAQGEAAARALLWLRLDGLLRVGVLWGAPSPVFAGAVLALTAAAGWISRAVEPPAVVAAVLLISRVWLWWRTRRAIERSDPGAATWRWSDGRRRSREEARRVLAGGVGSAAKLAQELATVRHALAGLARPDSPAPVVHEARGWDVGLVLAGATVLTVVMLVEPVTSGRAQRAAQQRALAVAAVEDPAKVVAEMETVKSVPLDEVTASPEELLATGRYEIVDDGFGRRLRGPLQKWELFAPADVERMAVRERAAASPEQAAFALVSGALLMQPYPRKSANVLLAVRVPTTRGFGVLVFNTRERLLVDREVRLLAEPLTDRTWYQIDQLRVLFLGAPLPMDAEISLAPR